MNGVSAIRPFLPPTVPVTPAVTEQMPGVRGPAPVVGPSSAPGAGSVEPASGTFENVLGGFVKDVNAQQMAAGDAVNGLLSGRDVSLHQAVIAMEEAGLSFQLMVEVRNKLLEAYQELMRMHV